MMDVSLVQARCAPALLTMTVLGQTCAPHAMVPLGGLGAHPTKPCV